MKKDNISELRGVSSSYEEVTTSNVSDLKEDGAVWFGVFVIVGVQRRIPRHFYFVRHVVPSAVHNRSAYSDLRVRFVIVCYHFQLVAVFALTC